MAKIFVLLQGDLQRMKKYNILAAGFIVALLWVATMHFLDTALVDALFVTLLFVDLVSMPAIMVAVSLFYEKQEGALQAMLVSPIRHSDYVWSKIFANGFSALLTVAILYAYAHFVRGFQANLVLLVATALLASGFHTLVGLLLTYGARDFTGMLMRYMVYAFVFMIPVLIDHTGLVDNYWFTLVLSACPPRAVLVLLDSSVGELNWGQTWYGLIYLVVVGTVLFRMAVHRFGTFAEKEMGV
ncbi:MAG: ABC transporter permease [Firmicutes bacterium]|nr:ABC transporter permease [Bacillota bacterium]